MILIGITVAHLILNLVKSVERSINLMYFMYQWLNFFSRNFWSFFLLSISAFNQHLRLKSKERKSNTVTERSARRGLADLPRAPCAPQASSGPREAGSSAALGARQRLLPDSPGPRGPASARPRAPTAHEGQSTGLCPRPGPGLRQPSGLRG